MSSMYNVNVILKKNLNHVKRGFIVEVAVLAFHVSSRQMQNKDVKFSLPVWWCNLKTNIPSHNKYRSWAKY